MVCRDWLGHVVAGLQLTIGLRAGYDASRQRLVGLAVTWTPYNPMTPLCMCIVFRLTAQGRGVSTSYNSAPSASHNVAWRRATARGRERETVRFLYIEVRRGFRRCGAGQRSAVEGVGCKAVKHVSLASRCSRGCLVCRFVDPAVRKYGAGSVKTACCAKDHFRSSSADAVRARALCHCRLPAAECTVKFR